MNAALQSACPDLAIDRLREAYAQGKSSPTATVEAVYARIAALGETHAWIALVPREQALARAAELEAAGPGDKPLWGIPFAVKDNIDVAGMPTTAACPAFAYTPEKSATVVQRLVDAGAIVIGKTNLDQFATGLVGTRSPYGAPSSVFSAAHVSGGSSSGSAVVVANGSVSFALGTDTAGSGRVPAMFNNIVGHKPTKGWLPTTGVVPACRSIDCVSVLALSSTECWQVLSVAGGVDATDPWSRAPAPVGLPARPRIGVLRADQREFYGDTESAAAYDNAIAGLAEFGDIVEFDFAPFREAALMLYEGAPVAERLEAAGDMLATNPRAMDPTVAAVVAKGNQFTAKDAWAARTRLEALRKQAEEIFAGLHVLALPTSPTHNTHAAVQADPVARNSQHGHYTNFANLLDLACIAVPTGFKPDGLPVGITLFGPAWSDAALAALGERVHRASGLTGGATGHVPVAPATRFDWPAQADEVRVVVVGAHLSGMPLNRELTERAARFVCATQTAPHYRLYALPNTTPPKPGLVRVADGGTGIAVEVWAMSRAAYGDFVSRIPPPMGIGNVVLADGSTVQGFWCESIALQGAQDISEFGGWRAYIASLRK
ncbi:MAG: allophanate hydrolase [Moraxellaceae bacterium]|nr:allophanate hydrolase [Moraxellaceae bacterium]